MIEFKWQLDNDGDLLVHCYDADGDHVRGGRDKEVIERSEGQGRARPARPATRFLSTPLP